MDFKNTVDGGLAGGFLNRFQIESFCQVALMVDTITSVGLRIWPKNSTDRQDLHTPIPPPPPDEKCQGFQPCG